MHRETFCSVKFKYETFCSIKFKYETFRSNDTFRNYRFDTSYQAFFYALIGARVSHVLDIINKDSSNNDIFYNECVLVIVLFAKRFERVVSVIKRL